MGATAAAITTTGAATIPLAIKAAGVKAALGGSFIDEPLLAIEQEWLLRQIPAEGIAMLLIVGELVEWFESVIG